MTVMSGDAVCPLMTQKLPWPSTILRGFYGHRGLKKKLVRFLRQRERPFNRMIFQRAVRRACNPFRSPALWPRTRRIEVRRAALVTSDELFEDIDYGVGDPQRPHSIEEQKRGVATTARISDFAGYSKPPRQCRLLYYLTRLKRPTAVLEMGTCVGISAAYLATALKQNGHGHLWTIEGSPKIADIATQTLSGLGLPSIATVVRGPFHQALAPILASRKFDLIFVDGHHDGGATVAYFEQIKSHLSRGAVVLFDDIAWSDDMAAAWRTITRDPALAEHSAALGFGFCQLR
jgi:predicted O-methyltransferase YrrM